MNSTEEELIFLSFLDNTFHTFRKLADLTTLFYQQLSVRASAIKPDTSAGRLTSWH